MQCRRILTLVTGLVECMGFAGIIFGWASLVFVLKKEHYFENLCPSPVNQSLNTTFTCPSQDEKLSLVFTIAAFINNVMAFPSGIIFDCLGTLVTRFIAIFLYTAATLLIAFSTSDTALLLFPAFSLLATGGINFILTNIQAGNLFDRHRSTIITLYNGAFDSSSVIFLIFKVLYQKGISLRIIFFSFSAFSILHILRTIFLMPKKHIPYPVPKGYQYGLQCGKHYADVTKTTEVHNDEDTQIKTIDKSENIPIKPALKDQSEVPSFWSCVFSSLFFYHLIWLSIMQLRHYMFIGTLNPTLTHLSKGDTQIVSQYTNVFAIFQFCGILCAPWNGLIMDRHKKKNKVSDSLADMRSAVLSLALTAVQCVLFSLCAAIQMLPALYATFTLQVLNRSFLYGGNAAFLFIAFPAIHFGKLYGLIMSLSALVSLLQYPAFYIIKTYLHGDPFYVNIAFLILVFLAFLHPVNVFRICRKRQNQAAVN
ncbi:equilibrative nucleobase transporter 1 [Bombina bombina]|uniref:equilibrative nucleobase transporter 1 n=1 Tax=Bombina bombina TaxID=8345 RepID=UPI00235A5958|nr:equilibrative nucleobase transporter 1 [Bombina bombina]XP_053548254.1 equilibrative nucleobase transporter 1 [Bombina bombina]XP_053548255.1 equilibrative nucleobase transporter 1 [Bombina bombina]XP_053548256.1 equilibrative nucleobase transporter 1 [Bombina bombina]